MDFHCTVSDLWFAKDSISTWPLAELTAFISAVPLGSWKAVL